MNEDVGQRVKGRRLLVSHVFAICGGGFCNGNTYLGADREQTKASLPVRALPSGGARHSRRTRNRWVGACGSVNGCERKRVLAVRQRQAARDDDGLPPELDQRDPEREQLRLPRRR